MQEQKKIRFPGTILLHRPFISKGIKPVIADNYVIHIQIKLRKIHDTRFLTGKCKGDTVYITRKIPVEKIKIVKPDRLDNFISRLPWMVIGLICLVLLFVFIRWVPKR